MKICSKCKESKNISEFYVRSNGKSRSECKECYRLARKNYRKNNDKVKEYNAKYYQKNKDKLIKKQQKYYYENIEERRKKQREYEQIHREERKEYNREFKRRWRKTPLGKELTRIQDQKRRSLKKQLPSTLTLEQWEDILKEFNYECAYCGCTDKKLTQEHMIPLIKGGGYTKDNIVPACQSCNSKKGTMLPEEYLHKIGVI